MILPHITGKKIPAFIFHSNLSINPNKIKRVPNILSRYLYKMKNHFSSFPSSPSSVASQCLWNNKHIKIDYKTIFRSSLSTIGINFVDQLFQNNQQFKKGDELKMEFGLIENEKFFVVQITHAVPSL